jgi:hypothetical protein
VRGRLVDRRRVERATAIAMMLAGSVGIAVVIDGWTDRRPPPDVGSVPTRSLGPLVAPPVGPPRAVPLPAAIATHAARLDAFEPSTPLTPVRLSIEPGGLAAEIVPVGVDSTGEAMALPPEASVVAWYRFGPSPGGTGSAVIAGHVDFGGRPGAFFHLGLIDVGAIVTIEFADGSARAFTITARRTYAKADLPVAELFRADGPPGVVLVTCGGPFDRGLRSYQDNVVLYAMPT